MSKPKYAIGDAFLITKTSTVDGCKLSGKFSHYILAVSVESTDRGYSYRYGLGRTFPQAYVNGPVTTWLYEGCLDELERAEGYFG